MIEPDVVAPSPNFNDAPVRGHTVIIHCTRSGQSMNPSEFEGTLGYFAGEGNPSSHWVIARDGRAALVVADRLQAWHAASDNDNAWGIELEQGVEADGFTEPQIATLVAVSRDLMARYHIQPHHVATSTDSGFIGHEETAQGKSCGKSDPGGLFPWTGFINALVAPAEDRMIPIPNKIPEWWENRDIQASPRDGSGAVVEFYTMQVASDLGLPPEAQEAIFAVYKASGAMRFLHGVRGPQGETMEARALGWATDGAEYAIVRLTMAADGTAPFVVDGAGVHIDRMLALGYA